MCLRLATITLALYILQASTLIACAQPTPPANADQPATPTGTASSVDNASASNAASQRSARLREGFKIIAEGSRELTGWSLAIIGASVAMIIGTGYFRPPSKRVRRVYLLFIPSWAFFAASIYKGNLVINGCISAAIGKDEVLDNLGKFVSLNYASQIFFLQTGLFFFSIWLISFLLWWVFGDHSKSTAQEEVAK